MATLRQALERRLSIRTYLCTADNPPGSDGASECGHTKGHGARKAKERHGALNPKLVRSIIINFTNYLIRPFYLLLGRFERTISRPETGYLGRNILELKLQTNK